MQDLLERLAAHHELLGVPRGELEWLAQHGTLRRFRAGELVMPRGSPVDEMFVQFTGTIVTEVNRASGRRDFLENHAGEITALLPFSRVTSAPGDTYVIEDAEALAVHRNALPELIRECPEVV